MPTEQPTEQPKSDADLSVNRGYSKSYLDAVKEIIPAQRPAENEWSRFMRYIYSDRSSAGDVNLLLNNESARDLHLTHTTGAGTSARSLAIKRFPDASDLHGTFALLLDGQQQNARLVQELVAARKNKAVVTPQFDTAARKQTNTGAGKTAIGSKHSTAGVAALFAEHNVKPG